MILSCTVRQEILSFHANEDRYIDLKASVGRQQVVPFIGSGMSVPSGLPTWSDLLKKVARFAQCDLSELERLINCSNFEKAADLLSEKMHPRLMAERVSHDLRVTQSDIINGPVCLLPALFPNLVITTNLDNVLEQVYGLCIQPFVYTLGGKQLVDYRQLKNPGEGFLLKLHGDCQSQDALVVCHVSIFG